MNSLASPLLTVSQEAENAQASSPETTKFSLILLRKGKNRHCLSRVLSEILDCPLAVAGALSRSSLPFIIREHLSESHARQYQLDLLETGSVSVYIGSELIERADPAYLRDLFRDARVWARHPLASSALKHASKIKASQHLRRPFHNSKGTPPAPPPIDPSKLEVSYKEVWKLKQPPDAPPSE